MAGFSKSDITFKEDRRHANWIAANKVKHFKTLFNAIKNSVGSYDKAMKVIGISNCNMDLMNKGKLSAPEARKIYLAYEKYCKK